MLRTPEGGFCAPSVATAFYRCPYGQPGDRLWVRETWGSPDADHPLVDDGHNPEPGDRVVYRANKSDNYQWSNCDTFVWRPSIFMPKWASRILLEVTDVRVERVQEITIDDIEAEGVYRIEDGQDCGRDTFLNTGNFLDLWDSINAKRGFGWNTNPWVWVVEFKRVVVIHTPAGLPITESIAASGS